MAGKKSDKQVKTVDVVLATDFERFAIGDHTFVDRPPKVSEKALFQRFFKAEAAVLEGDEDALADYAKELVRILNAREPEPGPVSPEWALEQDSAQVTEGIILIGTGGKAKRKQSQQDQS